MKNVIIPYQEKEFDLEEFNDETRRLDSLNYNLFLNEKFYKNQSIADVLYKLQHLIPYKPSKKINKGITIDNSVNLVLEFYEQLGLRKNLEPILTNKHPMFNTIIDKSFEDSYVSHSTIDPKITFSVGCLGTFYGAINMAHESSHAICGYYTEFAKLVDEQNKALTHGLISKEYNLAWDNIEKCIRDVAQPKKDCISEINTYIIENLFLEFAEKKNLISPEDKISYKNLKSNSIRRDIEVIIEEELIYRNIRYIKEKLNNTNNSLFENEYLQLKEELSKHNSKEWITKRLNFISKRQSINKQNTNCKFRFRYVVAEIFSTVWMNNYLKSNKKEKQKMIDNFKTFLLNNLDYDIDSTTELLLPNETYETIINKFVELVNSKNQELSQ